MKIDLKRVSEISLYIRYLSLLAVERAKSGHPGMPLGVAEAAKCSISAP
jgi:transketolase